MYSHEKVLLDLVGRSLFGTAVKLPLDVNWYAIHNEATDQTVLPIITSCITDEEFLSVPTDLKRKWREYLLQCYHSNETIDFVQQQILHLLNEHAIPCVILKGSSVAINYPKPELRIMGDIDVLVRVEDQMTVVKLLQDVGYEGDNFTHPSHIALRKNGISVEVHKQPYDLSKIMDQHILDYVDTFFEDAVNNRLYFNQLPILSDQQQAIVLILHNLKHFYESGLGLRQLCDWAVFVEKRMTDRLWKDLVPILKTLGLLQFTGVMTKTCILYLGLPECASPWAKGYASKLADKMIDQILNAGNFGKKIYENELSYSIDLYKSSAQSYIERIIDACQNNWMPCKNHPRLLAIAPPFAYINYLRNPRGEQRLAYRPIKIYKKASVKKKLLNSLKLFKPE